MMTKAHKQVKSQQKEILIEAYNNPIVEAYLEYEPWKAQSEYS